MSKKIARLEVQNSKESEMMVLGCMLTNSESLEKSCDSLDTSHFIFNDHKEIFQTLLSLYSQNNPADIHLVAEKLKQLDRLQKVGGINYLISLAQYAGTSAYIEHYIDLLIENTSKRNIMETLLSNETLSLEELKEVLDKKLDSAITRKTSVEFLYQNLLLPSSENVIVEEIKNISPGISMDMKIGDIDLEFPGGGITIVVAPTAHGKTTMLANQGLGVMRKNPNKSIYFFSLEESMSAIVILFLNIYMGKEISKNNRCAIERFFREASYEHIKIDEQQFFLNYKKEFFKNFIDNGRLNIFYNEMTAEQIIQAIKYLRKKRDDIGAIFIDYMQLLKSLETNKLNRQEQLKHICLILKNCAIETGLPIILAAQFNRQVCCEADLLSTNIGEAGDIERIASLIIGFWNRNFLGTKEGNKPKIGNIITEPKSEIYIEVLKGRKIGNGHSSVLQFNGNTGKIFSNNETCISTNKVSYEEELSDWQK